MAAAAWRPQPASRGRSARGRDRATSRPGRSLATACPRCARSPPQWRARTRAPARNTPRVQNMFSHSVISDGMLRSGAARLAWLCLCNSTSHAAQCTSRLRGSERKQPRRRSGVRLRSVVGLGKSSDLSENPGEAVGGRVVKSASCADAAHSVRMEDHRMRPSIPGLPARRRCAKAEERRDGEPVVRDASGEASERCAFGRRSGSGVLSCLCLGLCSGRCVELAPAMGQELVETGLRPARLLARRSRCSNVRTK